MESRIIPHIMATVHDTWTRDIPQEIHHFQLTKQLIGSHFSRHGYFTMACFTIIPTRSKWTRTEKISDLDLADNIALLSDDLSTA